MKLTAFILVLGCLMAGLQGKAQIVTISVKEAKLESVLKIFKKQTGYTFFVDEPTLKKASKVTLRLDYVPLKEALEKCFSGQPDLVYSVVGKTVVISDKNPEPRDNGTQYAQKLADTSKTEVAGVVFNKRQEPLANASVMLVGTRKGTSTNPNGSFTLPEVKPGNILRVSFIGYKTTEIPISSTGKLIRVQLEEANNELDEVVAQGYSKTTTRFSTSTVAKVSGEEIARQPVMDPLLTLQGKVPGMLLTPVSTLNGTPVKIDVRGRGLLSEASENPLIIIDGIPMGLGSNRGVAFGDGPVQGLMAYLSPAGSQSPLFGLSPKEIESVEVLKDLGATAIYGSSGANGVILITTKRGKANEPSLSVNVNFGIAKILRYYDLLNTQQYVEMRREALKNDGLIPSAANAPDLVLWDTTRYTDWQRELWGKAGMTMDASVSYSGGTPLLKYRIGANYSRPGKITAVTGKDQTMGVNLAIDRQSENRKLNSSLTVGYMSSTLNMVSAPSSMNLPPNAPPIFDSMGELNYKDWLGSGFENVLDGFGALLKPVDSRSSALNASLQFSYLITKGLNLSAIMAYSTSNSTAWAIVPIRSQNPAKNPTGSSSLSKSDSRTWSFEPQLSYRRNLFGRSSLSVMTGMTLRSSMIESSSSRGLGFTNDATLRAIALAPVMAADFYRTQYKLAGVMARMEYIWDEKYVVNAIGRRDGSSRFGPGRRFGNFGSVGVAWIASEEQWIKKILSPVVSYLKFNANTGTAGSDGGADYQYLSQWSRGQLALYDNIVPMKNLHAVNQFYQWALSKEWVAEMHIRFKGAIKPMLNITYYDRRKGNQLTSNPTPIYTGFDNVYGNWDATTQNTGWEFKFSASPVNSKNFTWSGSVNASINRNVLLEYPQIERTPDFSKYLVGQSLNTRYLLNYLGIDPMTGSYQYEDYNKDGLINSASVLPPLEYPSDKQKTLIAAPVVFGGTTHNFSYKNLNLSIAMDYAIQKGMNVFGSVTSPGRFGNIPLEIFNNRWQKTGDNAKYARFTTGSATNYQHGVSTLFYSDASYFRFKNVALSYNFPAKLLRSMGMQNCSFNIHTQNLFTITKYEGVDPEIRNFSGMPPARTITFGIAATF